METGNLDEHHYKCRKVREERDNLRAENEELKKLVRPWVEAKGVYHRHGGIDWPSAEKCELCQKDQRIAELEDRFKHVHQNAHDGSDRCAHCGLDLRDPVHARSYDDLL